MRMETPNATQKPLVIDTRLIPMVQLTAHKIAIPVNVMSACVTRILPRESPSTILNGAPRITSLEADSIEREHAKVPHREWAHPLKRVVEWKTFQRSATRRQIMTRAVGTMDSMQLATIGMVIESRLDFIQRKKNISITDLIAHHKHAAKMVL